MELKVDEKEITLFNDEDCSVIDMNSMLITYVNNIDILNTEDYSLVSNLIKDVEIKNREVLEDIGYF